MFKKFSVFAIAMMFFIVPLTGRAQSGPRIIQTCNINDIGYASFDNWGPIIYWNPCAANQVGPLVAAFYFQHELGHVYRQTSNEDEADWFAVEALRNTNPAAIEAFIQHKYAQGWQTDGRHRPGIDRAQFVRYCYSNPSR